MSWLFKTLSSDDHGVSSSSPAAKDDLSAIGHTIGRQFRGVAAFLAPPPLTEASKIAAESSSSDSESNSEALLGLRSDLAEIGGSLKNGLTVLSSNGNKAVGEISRLASNFLPFPRKPEGEEYDDNEEEEDFDGYGEDYVPGITDDVLQFVTDISDRSECWTDFPLRLDHGFSMSDAQREHATTIEQYISDFAALRERLCTSSSMNEQVFWMIYFILLVPRLSGRDSELLSTPEIVNARDALLQKLRNKEAESDTPVNLTPTNTSQAQIPVSKIQSLEQDFPKVRVSDEANANKPIDESVDSSAADIRFETEDDISFSDLEDDDGEVSRRSMANNGSGLGPSNDWVQLNESGQRKKDSEGEDSSGWLNVDDFD